MVQEILHIKVGQVDMGDGMPPWIPSPEDLEHVREVWADAIPEGVKLIVTSIGVEAELITTTEAAKLTIDQIEMGPFGLVDIDSADSPCVLHTKQWDSDLLDEDGLLDISSEKYWKMRSEGYGPAMLKSDAQSEKMQARLVKV